MNASWRIEEHVREADVNSHPLASDWFYSKSQGPGGQVGPLDWEQLVLLGAIAAR